MTLSFHPSILGLCGMIMVCAVGSLLCLRARRCAVSRSLKRAEFLHLLVFLILGVLLLDPEVILTTRSETTPKLFVLTDCSPSMETNDVVCSSDRILTRSAYAAQVVASLDFSVGNEAFIPECLSICSSSPTDREAHTDLAEPLQDILRSKEATRAIVMLTDGDHNVSTSLPSCAQQLRLRGIPLYMVPIGSDGDLPDVSLEAVNAPSYGFVGNAIQVSFSVSSTLEETTELIVSLQSESGEIKRQTVSVPAHGSANGMIDWPIRKEGSETLRLSIPSLPQDKNPSNNEVTFSLRGRRQAIRVLLIESLPRWEYRFLRNAFIRDPEVEVRTLLLFPDSDDKGEGVGYLRQFPDEKELQKFDVIFIGDVGLGSRGLSPEQATHIRECVGRQACGLVFLPGKQDKQRELLESDLADLFPIFRGQGGETQRTVSDETSFCLTPEGKGSLLLRFADQQEDNERIWRSLPGSFWHAPVMRAKAGASVLAVHPSEKNEWGRIPLIVAQSFGLGKVLFMGTDAAWKWRKGVEDRYHYRFWSQVARWMSYRRHMTEGKNIRFFLNPDRPHVGEAVSVHAFVATPDGSPLQDGEVYLDIESPTETERLNNVRMRLNRQVGTWGGFVGMCTFDQSGERKLTVSASDPNILPASLSVHVLDENPERIGRPVNRRLMNDVSRISGARMIEASKLPEILQDLRHPQTMQEEGKRVPLRTNPYVISFLVLLLCVYWIRKRLGQ